jgi:plastocyanin
MGSKVKIMEGGTVAPGETFDWENHADSQCNITGTSGFLTESSYTVAAKNGSTPGSTPATVLEDVADGAYSYSASNSKKRSNPTIHVNSGKP